MAFTENSESNLRGLFPSLDLVLPGGQSQVIRPGGRYLKLLICLMILFLACGSAWPGLCSLS